MLPSFLWQTAAVAGRKLVWPLIGCGTQWLVHSEDAGDQQPGAETRGCQVPRVPASLMISTDCPTVSLDRQVQCATHCQGGLRKPLPDNGRHASQASCSGNRFSQLTSCSLPLPSEATKATPGMCYRGADAAFTTIGSARRGTGCRSSRWSTRTTRQSASTAFTGASTTTVSMM